MKVGLASLSSAGNGSGHNANAHGERPACAMRVCPHAAGSQPYVRTQSSSGPPNDLLRPFFEMEDFDENFTPELREKEAAMREELEQKKSS